MFLLGLPALIRMVGTIPAFFVMVATSLVASKIARFMLALTLFLALFWGLHTAFKLFLVHFNSGVASLLPQEALNGLSNAMPYNFDIVVTAILGAKLAILIFDIKVHILGFITR